MVSLGCHLSCHTTALLAVGPPTIHCYESSIAVAPGSLVSFVCRVQAYPGPVTISWDGSAERTNVSSVGIRNKYYTFISVVNAWNSTLSFKDFVEVNDSGMYTITARNSFGESSLTVELHVHREFTAHDVAVGKYRIEHNILDLLFTGPYFH